MHAPSDHFDYEEEEPQIYDGDDDQPDGAGDEDPEAAREDNIVAVGEQNRDSAAAAKNTEKNTVTSLKEKRVPDDKRTTTPYMTKYEKARVLGTRALQIRYADWAEAMRRPG